MLEFTILLWQQNRLVAFNHMPAFNYLIYIYLYDNCPNGSPVSIQGLSGFDTGWLGYSVQEDAGAELGAVIASFVRAT